MPNFETGVLTRSKSEVNDKKRVKIDRSDFEDDFEIFRKFHKHFISNFKSLVLTNDGKRHYGRFKFTHREIKWTKIHDIEI